MPEFNEKPTIELVQQATEYLQSVWGTAHTHWQFDLDPMYFRTYDPWPKNSGRPIYRPSTPTSIVDRASDTQEVLSPEIHREPPTNNEGDRLKADAIENALNPIVYDAAIRQNMISAYQLRWQYMQHLNYVVGELGFDWRSRPIEPKREDKRFNPDGVFNEDAFKMAGQIWQAAIRSWNPFRIMSPHPSSVLMDPEESIPTYGIKMEIMRAQDVLELSQRKKNPVPGKLSRRNVNVFSMIDGSGNKRNPFDSIMVKHWTTLKWNAFIVDEEILWIDPNWMGFVRFTHAFSGRGIQRTSDAKSGIAFDPRHFTEGMLGPIKDSLVMESQREASLHKLLVDRANQPTYTDDIEPDELADVTKQGGFARAQRGSIWTPDLQQVPQSMFQTGVFQSADIAKGSFAMDAAGFRQPGVDSASQQAILSVATSKQFQTSLVQLQDVASREASMILQAVDALSKKTTVQQIGLNGKNLTAKDISHDYTVTAEFDNRDPLLQLQWMELGLREFQQGLLSDQGYWRDRARVKDISGMQEELREQGLRRRPSINEALSEATIERIGFEDVAARADEIEAEAQEGREEPRQPSLGEPVQQETQNKLRDGVGPNTQSTPRV